MLQLAVGDTFFLLRSDSGEDVFPWTIFSPALSPDSASGQSTTVSAPGPWADEGGEVASGPALSRTAAAAAAPAAAATIAAAGKVGSCRSASATQLSAHAAICKLVSDIEQFDTWPFHLLKFCR